MSLRKRIFLFMGYIYDLLYRMPLVGDAMVRGINRSIGFLNYRSPYGPRSHDSISALGKDLERLLDMADLEIEVVQQGEEKLELIITSCPYGFCRPEQMGVCDAAMDMDRAMFGYCGFQLQIDECIPAGAKVCRVSIHRTAGPRRP
jgi:hypothetical protein